jgi:uncharacterized DUF497 family protein
MRYEYDPNKSAANKEKHGVNFEEAKALWDDPCAITATAQSETEPRFLVIGRIDKIFWTAIITYRGAAVWIISVRRSRKYEEEHYGKINNR